MKVHRGTITLQSTGLNPTFHDITGQVTGILRDAAVSDGICVVYSPHTTCSVMIQECGHDQTYFGIEYLQQDLVNVMERIVPTCRSERQYMHPGPKHIDFAKRNGTEEGEWTSLNTDAHLRSVLFGRSETIIVADGSLELGQFGHVYFVDWDQVRSRTRLCHVQVMGE